MKSVGELSVGQAHDISCRLETIENLAKALRKDVFDIDKYDTEMENGLMAIRTLAHNASGTLRGEE